MKQLIRSTCLVLAIVACSVSTGCVYVPARHYYGPGWVAGHWTGYNHDVWVPGHYR